MCKYFNQDPKLNKDDNIRDIKYKLVLDDLSVDRLEVLGITKLCQLLDMVENNDYSILYLQCGLGKIISNRLVKKIQVIYNYLVSSDKIGDCEFNNQNLALVSDVTFDDSYNKYNELQSLITKLNTNCDEIKKVQITINEIEKKNVNNGEKNYCDVTNNTSILEVRNFFSTGNFEYLIKRNVFTLYDLFNDSFLKTLMNHNDRPYNERLKIIATIKILRCKYLGEDPKISTKISYKVFENLLGISFKTQMFLHNKMGINNLTELLQLIENKDFSKLNQIESEDLIPKLVVLYNFNKIGNVKNDNHNNNDKLLDLYMLLKELIIQNNSLIERIKVVQSKLNPSLQKVKS